MITTGDLLRMYTTAQTILHEQVATELANAIGRNYDGGKELRSAAESFDYFQGRRVSSLYDRVNTLRLLTDSNVSDRSTDFLSTFWDVLSDRVIESNLGSYIEVPVRLIRPIQVIAVDGFVDLVIDLEEGIRLYKATAF